MFDRRKFVRALQPEILQKIEGYAVSHRVANRVGASELLHQIPRFKRRHHAIAVHPAQHLDLRFGDRLAISDDRERLERRGRQTIG